VLAHVLFEKPRGRKARRSSLSSCRAAVTSRWTSAIGPGKSFGKK
jgi:hypothetical protein